MAETFDADDAFCLIADVQARASRGAYHATDTRPTSAEVTTFMALRAGEIQAALIRGGSEHTPPSGSSAFSDSETDPEVKSLRDMCRNANAIGAAIDALYAHDVRDNPDVTYDELQKEWDRLVGTAGDPGAIEKQAEEVESSTSNRSAIYESTDDGDWPWFDSDTEF